jgi:hypothetical protein
VSASLAVLPDVEDLEPFRPQEKEVYMSWVD